MGKIALADQELSKIWVCRRCSARNRVSSTKLKPKKCRKCGSTDLRPKRKSARGKK